MAISAFTPRRAYATAGIIALFLIPSIVAGVVTGLGSSGIGHWLILPARPLSWTGRTPFCSTPTFELGVLLRQPARLAYFAAVLGGIAAAVAITIRRFARITA